MVWVAARVAPVIAYVPEGAWEPATGHMQKPGSISLPDDKGFTDLLEAAANSMKGSGFKNIIFIGESGELVALQLFSPGTDGSRVDLVSGEFGTARIDLDGDARDHRRQCGDRAGLDE